MNKVFGTKECFIPVREDETRIVISYDYTEEPDEVNATWWEVYVNKVDKMSLGFEDIKSAILKDIDTRTDYKIENGLVWTSFEQENIPVKLDAENKFNFKASYDLAVQTNGAILPVTFKMSEVQVYKEPEEEGGIPEKETKINYHTFSTMEESTDFYMKAIAFIQGCYQEGWQKKDNFDFSPYKQVAVVEQESEQENTEEE